jgi:hypothetical protein
MIINRRHIPRRTVLRGAGASIALPLLDAMVPAFTSTKLTAANPVHRLGVVYVPMGMNMAKYTPPVDGELSLSPILQPLDPYRNRMLVLSGLDIKQADARDGGVHSRCQSTWLTGVKPKATEGVDLHAGISMDQIVAREIGSETQLGSLEIGIEEPAMAGSCGVGYSCVYSSTIAWRNDTTPLRMENNPRAVFERLFGASDTTDSRTRLSLLQRDHSILDAVGDRLSWFRRQVGAGDTRKLDQYLDAVRDVERRVQKAEEQIGRELPVVDRPAGIPGTFEAHAKLMFDLVVLAYQTDMTRVSTYLMAREQSYRTYPEIGVPDPHHPLSHHQDDPEKLEKQAKLNTFMTQMFAYFVGKLAATLDGEGSLLDHTLLLFGSGMSNSNEHLMDDVPTVVIANPNFRVNGGRHVRYNKGTPLTNLQLTLMDRMGVRVEHFANSTGQLDLLGVA